MSELRAAIIGATGGRGRTQVSILSQDERLKITTLCCRHTENAELRERASALGAGAGMLTLN